ncbi:hypothetical protein Acsp04_39810 [Actinomadura sp. NBRC 104425]|nr:hypothetical protein Acsp04_39810 [Actinomadura sp. NBRC 104425]
MTRRLPRPSSGAPAVTECSTGIHASDRRTPLGRPPAAAADGHSAAPDAASAHKEDRSDLPMHGGRLGALTCACGRAEAALPGRLRACRRPQSGRAEPGVFGRPRIGGDA